MQQKKKCKICGKMFLTSAPSRKTCGDVECWAANNEARKRKNKLTARRYKKFNTSIKKEQAK